MSGQVLQRAHVGLPHVEGRFLLNMVHQPSRILRPSSHNLALWSLFLQEPSSKPCGRLARQIDPQLIEDAWCSLWREGVLSDTDIVDELCEQGLEQYRLRLQQRDGQHAAGAMTDEVHSM